MYRRAVVRQAHSVSAFYSARLQTRVLLPRLQVDSEVLNVPHWTVGPGGFKKLSSLAGDPIADAGNPEPTAGEISGNDAQPPIARPLLTASEPLPPVPAPVSGYPTPWIAKEDVEEYILPLYARGWGVEFKRQPRTHKSHALNPPIACLVIHYGFSGYDSTISFLNEVVGIARSENHHPSIAIMNGKIPKMTLITQTDSAIRPEWEEGETQAARKMPGLTRRDLRFAVLVDTLYDTYVSDGRGVDIKRTMRPLNRRPSWDRLLRTFKKNVSNLASTSSVSSAKSKVQNSTPKRECPACGELHHIAECPERKSIQPPSPCTFCKGDHWIVDCPKKTATKLGRRNVPSVAQVIMPKLASF
ncbi:hypothetical protein BD779DRAFT_1669840 [Infundibulicybe gibba]|nr:hypothetical protein BD779DRAFT_1669840 [Infundibulicybe gibba]